jgi:GntR family transcriptional regulator
VELAAGTDVGNEKPLADGLLGHLAARKGVTFDHVAQRLSARAATTEEASLLDLPRREPLLSVVLSVCDRTAAPLVCIDLVIPTSRHELEDVFPLV